MLIVNVLLMLLQAGFAGRILAGDRLGVLLHENTARTLVLLGAGQLVAAILLLTQGQCPGSVPFTAAGLLAAELIEFAAGHFHSVTLHVPLGVALFGGSVRLLLRTKA